VVGLGWWFVAAAAADVAAAAVDDGDGFLGCNWMWVFHNFQKLIDNLDVLKACSHWNLGCDGFSC